MLVMKDNLINQRVLQQQLQNVDYIIYVVNHNEKMLNQLKQSTY